MTINQLEETAVFKGNIMIGRRFYQNGIMEHRDTFHEITHYFNADLEEIGMVAEWNKVPLIFDTPRIWHESFLTPDKIRIVRIN
jgi:hypothetical protein